MKGAIMHNFEMRFSKNDIWGDWMPVADPYSVEQNVFGPRSRFIKSVRYEYSDGSFIEYRRVKEHNVLHAS